MSNFANVTKGKLVLRTIDYLFVSSQSVHIHCGHTILAHLFIRDFFSLPYSHTLLVSLSISCPILSLSFSVSLFLSPTHSPIYLSLSHTLLITFSLRFFPPFLFFSIKDSSTSIMIIHLHPFHPLIITDDTNLLCFLLAERNV